MLLNKCLSETTELIIATVMKSPLVSVLRHPFLQMEHNIQNRRSFATLNMQPAGAQTNKCITLLKNWKFRAAEPSLQ
jgi:hypothetical protein